MANFAIFLRLKIREANIRAALHHFREFHKNHVRHNSAFKNKIDSAVYVVGTFGACMTLPQIITLYTSQDASSLSIVSWVGFLVAAIFWLIYGITHLAKPIVFINTLWIIFDLTIIVGILIF